MVQDVQHANHGKPNGSDAPKTWAEILEPTLRKQQLFVRLPACVALCGALSAGSRLYYGVVLYHAWRDDKNFPGQVAFALEMGCSPRSLRDYNQELAIARLLKIERQGRGLTNRYVLLPLDGFAEWLQSRPAKSAALERSVSAGLEVPLSAALERSVSAGPIRDDKDVIEDARDALFEAFWTAYPEHARGGRRDAQQAWRGAVDSTSLAQAILNDVAARKASGEWMRDGGRFVPRADRYLTGSKWRQPQRNNRASGLFDGLRQFLGEDV